MKHVSQNTEQTFYKIDHFVNTAEVKLPVAFFSCLKNLRNTVWLRNERFNKNPGAPFKQCSQKDAIGWDPYIAVLSKEIRIEDV